MVENNVSHSRHFMPVHHRAAAALYLMLLSVVAVAQVPVQVEKVSNRAIVRQVNVTGTVTSPRTALLSTAVAGLVAQLTIDEGHRVETGDALLKLDAELARLALERARAEVRQRETAVADARRRFAEADEVGTQRGIARTQIESLRAEVSSDEAALVASQAAAREQQAIVERHTLKAPFAGVISERHAELGEWVNPGDGLLELVATDNLRFDFRVGQDNFAALSPDTLVEITLDALPERSIAGHVDTIVPIKDPGARTFLVRVLADTTGADNPPRITPGMSARGKLNIDAGRRGVAVSRDAILRFPDGRVTVWVVDTGGELPVVREQVVRTGFEFEGVVEITNGLADGDVVVVRGNETLQEGQTVSIQDGRP
ncbi:MAG: efflux RND transporter periplasmic adaptor subunit [Gammaproteobacteria bacterium]|nr:efflux RND transporter periplasmic adaptor subunit [Gammaproteobacteria bacterium]